LCQNPENLLIVSVVSSWEMQIKLQLGKLKLQLPLKDIIANQQKTNQVAILPIILPHVLALSDLPVHHGDPFDRLWHEHLVERKVTHMLDLQGQLIVIENVPARVNVETGEQLFAPETVERLQQIIWQRHRPKRMIQVPVYEYT